ncbi:MAG: hypothetical protein ACKVQR_05425 [Aquabacterium sp.]
MRAFIALAVDLGAIIQATDADTARARDARFKAGAPEVFSYPAPQLGPGIWAGGHPAVGHVFPQPVLADGRRLDEAGGDGFVLLADPAVLAAANAAPRVRWATQGVRVLPATGAGATGWLAANGVVAVLLRPDRYVAAVAPDAAALDSVTDVLERLPAGTGP